MHRPGDGQLLAQLIKLDKDYASVLATLVAASAASRAGLSAYSAGSPSHISGSIAALSSALAGADDALHGYREAFEEWQHQLSRLKELQDEVQVVLRDRQILINRVIKVSKGTRSAAASATSPTGSSSSLTSHDTKVAQAQAELRACESYLAEKERDTEVAWTRAMRDGIRARAAALVQYGVACADRGRHALQQLDSASGHAAHAKPLPDYPNASHNGHTSSHSRSSSLDSPSYPVPLPRHPERLSMPPSMLPNGTLPSHLSYPPSSALPQSFNGTRPLSYPPSLDRPLPPPPPGSGSDHSSLTPSQSASQVDGLPGTANLSRQSSLTKRADVSGLPGPASTPQMYMHPGQPRTSMIMEEPEQLDIETAPEDGGSSEDEAALDASKLQVVENDPAKRASMISLHKPSRGQSSPTKQQNSALPQVQGPASRKSSRSTLARRPQRAQQSSGSTSSPVRSNFPSIAAPSLGRIPSTSSNGSASRGRTSSFSSSFLGGIASIFGSKKHGNGSAGSSPVRDRGTWSSRTDARLKRSGVTTAARSDSSDEDRRIHSDGAGLVTVSRSASGRSRKNSLRSIGKKKDDTTKIYAMANRPTGGGFSFARNPSASATALATKSTTRAGEGRSNSDLGPSTQGRSSSSTSPTRQNSVRPLDSRGPSLMALVEGATAAKTNGSASRGGVNGKRQSVHVVSSSSPSSSSTTSRAEKRMSTPLEPTRRRSSRSPEPERGTHEPVSREMERTMPPLRSALKNRSPSPQTGSVENEPASRSYAEYKSSPLKESTVLPTPAPVRLEPIPVVRTPTPPPVIRPPMARGSSGSSGGAATPIAGKLPAAAPAAPTVNIPTLSVVPPRAATPPGDSDTDAASVSSYETGHETLLGDPDRIELPDDIDTFSTPTRSAFPTSVMSMPTANAPPAPPTKSTPATTSRQVIHQGNMSTSDLSASSVYSGTPPASIVDVAGSPGALKKEATSNNESVSSTATSTTATRRKSVRMVLPPDFVGTPATTPTAERSPEMVYAAVPQRPHAPSSSSGAASQSRSGGWTTTPPTGTAAWTSRNGGKATDPWADSSDEDAEGDYARAKRALARVDQQVEELRKPRTRRG